MNTKRIFFWGGFVMILALIVWGLIAAQNKDDGNSGRNSKLGIPAPVTQEDHVRDSAVAKRATSTVATLIEYSDFQCPACESYYPLVTRLLASSSVPFHLVYRHYPLPQHPNAMIAAEASEAAALQGKFWEMHDLLFEDHQNWTELPEAHTAMNGYAEKIGLDMTKFKADIDSSAVKTLVENDRDEGQTLGINGTPTFFLNGKALENPQGYEQFKTILETAASGNKN